MVRPALNWAGIFKYAARISAALHVNEKIWSLLIQRSNKMLLSSFESKCTVLCCMLSLRKQVLRKSELTISHMEMKNAFESPGSVINTLVGHIHFLNLYRIEMRPWNESPFKKIIIVQALLIWVPFTYDQLGECPLL